MLRFIFGGVTKCALTAAILVSAAFSLAAQEPADRDSEPSPDRPRSANETYEPETADERIVGGVPESMIEQIDQISVDELQRLLLRAENALSRDGQEVLRDRAAVERLRDRAHRIRDHYAADRDVHRIQAALQSQEVMAEIEVLQAIENEEEFQSAFIAFLERHSFSERELIKYGRLRDAEETLTNIKTDMEAIDGALNGDLDEIASTVLNPSDPLADQLNKISAKYRDGSRKNESRIDRSKLDYRQLLELMIR